MLVNKLLHNHDIRWLSPKKIQLDAFLLNSVIERNSVCPRYKRYLITGFSCLRSFDYKRFLSIRRHVQDLESKCPFYDAWQEVINNFFHE